MKTLIFDFDGTIADSFEIFAEVLGLILKDSQKVSAEDVNRFRGMPFKQIVRALNIKSWQIPRMVLSGRRMMKSRMSKAKPFAGLSEVIKLLHKDGYQMFVLSTNSSVTINQFLKANGLDGCFSHIYGDIGLRSKAAGLKKVIKKHRLDKVDCTYIGDETRDVEAAKKVGIRSVGVGWGFNYPEAMQKAKPSALALKPQDLLKILSD